MVDVASRRAILSCSHYAYRVRSRNVHALEELPPEQRAFGDRETVTPPGVATMLTHEGLARLARHVARNYVARAPVGSETTLLPDTVVELTRLGLRSREIALDGGFQPTPTNRALEPLAADRVFIAGHQEPDSKRTTRRLARARDRGDEHRHGIPHQDPQGGLERVIAQAGLEHLGDH